MAQITAAQVNELRQKTGAGMMDCKNALVEAEGDINLALDFLRKSGIAKAEKKSSRDAKEGIIYSYIHNGNKLGVMLELGCETDFVAKTDGFIDLANNIAMQIAATNPLAINEENIDPSIIAKEKEIYTDQAKATGKPDNVIDKIVEGKLNKFVEDNCLMQQTFIKNPEQNITQLLQESVAKIGENITINRFVRFAIGESA